jgi:hypothetical protein
VIHTGLLVKLGKPSLSDIAEFLVERELDGFGTGLAFPLKLNDMLTQV